MSEKYFDFLRLNPKDFQIFKLRAKKSYLCFYSKKHLLFIYKGKTRFIMKNALFLLDIQNKIHCDFKKKYLFLSATLCSKTKILLEKEGYSIYDFV